MALGSQPPYYPKNGKDIENDMKASGQSLFNRHLGIRRDPKSGTPEVSALHQDIHGMRSR